MDLADLIAALSKPAAYPYPADQVEVRQTHISVVFLSGAYVYKLKKPVTLSFLDFSTLEKRHHFCEQEVRLNRRLAPDVYLGVVPVTQSPEGIQFEGEGSVVEWAVKMQRLPDAATLQVRLGRGEIGLEQMESFARRLAFFHRDAETNEHIASCGRFEAVARSFRDLFEQASALVGITVRSAVFGRVKDLAERVLARFRPLIEARGVQGMTRDCHGDLHLDHVYLFPERHPPDDLVVIDCIEFNDHLRFTDVVADAAFPAMDFAFNGRRDLARVFSEVYFSASQDEEGRSLMPMYTAYRAMVRATVEGLLLAEKEVSQGEQTAARERAKAHWLLALTELEEPDRRPCLVLVGGLPGSGKSTLSKGLSERLAFHVIRSDQVRKELSGNTARQPQPGVPFGQGIYTAEWTERTYAECANRAERLLFDGGRVLVDATFSTDDQRQFFHNLATRFGVPVAFLLCRAEPETCRARLATRHSDVSDADWSVHEKVKHSWQRVGPYTRRILREVDTSDTMGETSQQALEVLKEMDL